MNDDEFKAALKSILDLREAYMPSYMPSNHSCAFWIYNAVSRQRCDEAVADAISDLNAVGVQFDSIAFTGVSGDLFGPVLAYAMKKEILCVRRHTEPGDTHSDRDVEGYAHSERYLIVDDIVSSGSTINRIVRAIRQLNSKAECIGIYTYAGNEGGHVVGFVGRDNSYVQRAVQLAKETYPGTSQE